MRDEHRMEEKIELALEQRQVVLLAVAALILLGVVFAAGVQVGRSIAGTAAAAPAAPKPDDLGSIDAAHASGPQAAAARVEPRQPAPRAAAPEPSPAEEPAQLAPPARPAAAPRAAAPPEPAPPKPAARPAPKAAPPEEDDEPPPGPAAVKVAVVPAPPPPAVIARPREDDVHLTPPPAKLGTYTVQIGAAQEKREAQRLEQKARSAGLKPYVVEAHLGAKGTWFRVRVGAFENKDVANRYRQDVERELRLQAVVMPTR